MKFLSLFILMNITTMLFHSNALESPAPTKRSEMASTLWKGKIYVPGGINFFGTSRRFEAYNIKTKNWERLPNLPKN